MRSVYTHSRQLIGQSRIWQFIDYMPLLITNSQFYCERSPATVLPRILLQVIKLNGFDLGRAHSELNKHVYCRRLPECAAAAASKQISKASQISWNIAGSKVALDIVAGSHGGDNKTHGCVTRRMIPLFHFNFTAILIRRRLYAPRIYSAARSDLI